MITNYACRRIYHPNQQLSIEVNEKDNHLLNGKNISIMRWENVVIGYYFVENAGDFVDMVLVDIGKSCYNNH